MKKILVFSLLAAFISITGLSSTADAKRFGGGMNFGKSFSKQKSFSKPAVKPGANKASNAAKGARAGGMMGILGGLAMGGLLGALFFGGGFEGINFMDILIFGGIAFAIFWFMRRSAGARREPEYAHAGQGSPFGQQDNPQNQTFDSGEATSSSQDETAATPDLDTEQFENSAREIFIRMQKDWDTKNFEDIRAFCTSDVANHVITQIEELKESKTSTEVVTLLPEMAGTWIESELEWAAVHFQAMLKERTLNPDGVVALSEDTKINEVWVFQHNPKSDDPTWYLAGIQQL
ncbi:MAG: TIM44-like domain-containing protein [Ghiorsea sp.]